MTFAELRDNARMATRHGLRDFVDEPRAFSRTELVRKFSRSALDNALARGKLTRVLPGVYASTHHSKSTAVRSHAAVLWSGNGVIGGTSALYNWGLIDQPPAKVHLWIAPERRLKSPAWLVVHRDAVAMESTQRGLLTVAQPAFAIVHGFADLDPNFRADAVYRAVRRRLVGPDQLRAALAAGGRIAARRELERHIDAAERGAESYLEEHAMRSVFNTQPFARFVRQHDVVHEGQLFRLDMYDPLTKTAAECDGDRIHADPLQRRKDIRRDALLSTRGILTVRYGFRDLLESPAWCRMNLLEILRARGAPN